MRMSGAKALGWRQGAMFMVPTGLRRSLTIDFVAAMIDDVVCAPSRAAESVGLTVKVANTGLWSEVETAGKLVNEVSVMKSRSGGIDFHKTRSQNEGMR
mmetsp:Transcript_87488/g.174722  ORF Transcript_87488/g.174722 Transcript_87488/m.174722 type:complete len:99 (-) Transcript_87488:271-567(-)